MEEKLLIIADAIQIEETLFFCHSISRSFVSSNCEVLIGVCRGKHMSFGFINSFSTMLKSFLSDFQSSLLQVMSSELFLPG